MMMNLIPADRLGEALDAVARRQVSSPVAFGFGLSVPRLIQQCLELAEQPDVYAAHPAACRTILDRRDAARAARAAALLPVRVEV